MYFKEEKNKFTLEELRRRLTRRLIEKNNFIKKKERKENVYIEGILESNDPSVALEKKIKETVVTMSCTLP